MNELIKPEYIASWNKQAQGEWLSSSGFNQFYLSSEPWAKAMLLLYNQKEIIDL